MGHAETVTVGQSLNKLTHNGSRLGLRNNSASDDSVVKIGGRTKIDNHVKVRFVLVQVVEVNDVWMRRQQVKDLGLR